MVDNVKVIECALVIATQGALIALSRGETYETSLKAGSSGKLSTLLNSSLLIQLTFKTKPGQNRI